LIPVIPLSDSFAYDALAKTLATHGVFGWTADQPTSFWPVGTSALYAVLYILFGPSFTPIVILNIALGTLIVGQTMWLTRIFFDDETAIVAGSILAVWPSQIAFVTILASELPFTFFVLLGFCGWYASNMSRGARIVVSALGFAAATYVRPIAMLLPIVVWLTAIPDFRKLREQFSTVLMIVFLVAICITPWSIRNTRLYNHFMLLSSNGGVVLWMGNNPSSDGTYTKRPASLDALDEYHRDKQLRAAALSYIAEYPLGFALRTARKAILLHLNETIAVHWNAEGIKQRFGTNMILPLKLLTQAFWSTVVLLALIGVGLVYWERGLILTLVHPFLVPWIYFTAVYSVMLVQDRYHFSSHPFIAAFAATTIIGARRALLERRRDRA
jgi:hypothetical protein